MTKTTAATMPATTAHGRHAVHGHGRRLHRHRRRLCPRPGHRRPLVPLPGRRPNCPQGHLGPPCSSSPPPSPTSFAGAEGTALAGGFQRCVIPAHTVGTWTTKLTRLPVCGGWHALVYTTLAEYATEREQFLLLAPQEADGTRTASPLPGPAQSAAPAPLLGVLALAARLGPGRDHAAANRRPRRLRLPAQCRRPPGRPHPRRRRRHAHSAARGGCRQRCPSPQ